jgi:hypothetical protein
MTVSAEEGVEVEFSSCETEVVGEAGAVSSFSSVGRGVAGVSSRGIVDKFDSFTGKVSVLVMGSLSSTGRDAKSVGGVDAGGGASGSTGEVLVLRISSSSSARRGVILRARYRCWWGVLPFLPGGSRKAMVM